MTVPVRHRTCVYPGCAITFDPPAEPLEHEGHLFCGQHRLGGQMFLKRGWSLELLVHWPRCRWCRTVLPQKRYEHYIEDGWEPGGYVYCDAHAIIEGRDPELIAQRGLEEARELSEIPEERLVRWPLWTLDNLTGPLVPGRVAYVAGYSGGGKTTFMRNVIWRWVTQQGLRVRYLPLESSIKEVMTGFACFKCGVNPDDALSYRLRDRAAAGSKAAQVQRDELMVAYELLMRDREFCQNLRIEPMDTLSPARFDAAIQSTKAMGADVIVVDHVDHTEADAGDFSPQIQVSNRIQMQALRAAKELGIPVVLTSQLNSKLAGPDPLARLRPPRPEFLWNRGSKEMIGAVIIGLHRAIDPYASIDLFKKVSKGETEAWKAALPNTMAASEMKLRFGRGTVNPTVLMHLENGVLSNRRQDTLDPRDAGPLPAERPASTAWMDN
jgi:KaiC/GvpD/RAD55 family RecA-like ATPase